MNQIHKDFLLKVPKTSPQRARIVFTAAVKKELPTDLITGCGWPILTARALASGEAERISKSRDHTSIIFVITGVGKEKSFEAAKLIVKHLDPLAVVNVGSCGINCRAGASKDLLETIFVSEGTRANGVFRYCIKYPPFPIKNSIKIKHAPIDSLERPLLEHDPHLFQAVDMEAGFQNIFFSEMGVPFCSIKVPTDTCSNDTTKQYTKALAGVRKRLSKLLSFLDSSSFHPSISVIIPVHNRKRALEKAILSVKEQTYRPFEIIVVDDGSNPPLTMTSLKNHHLDNIRLITLKQNQGVSSARNLGIKEAKGDWISFLDSDDQWKEKKLENQVEYLRKHPFFEITQCDEIWIRNGKRVNRCKHHEKGAGWLWEKGLRICAISPSAVLMKRSLFDLFGMFAPELPACEDYDLWLRICRWKPVGLNPEADLIKYGGHEDQLSKRYPAMDRFRVTALLKALENEKEPRYRSALTNILKHKLSILYSGALKRNRLEDAKVYEKILTALNEQKAISWKEFPLLVKRFL